MATRNELVEKFREQFRTQSVDERGFALGFGPKAGGGFRPLGRVPSTEAEHIQPGDIVFRADEGGPVQTGPYSWRVVESVGDPVKSLGEARSITTDPDQIEQQRKTQEALAPVFRAADQMAANPRTPAADTSQPVASVTEQSPARSAAGLSAGVVLAGLALLAGLLALIFGGGD